MLKNKENLLIYFENSIDRVKRLTAITEEQWRTPIAEGKWSIAEIVGHLIPWDRYITEQRLPFLLRDKDLPNSPDVNQLNQQAATLSRMKTKGEIIEEFIANRRKLIIAINNIPVEIWEKEFMIGSSTLTLYNYLLGIIEHDEHHFEQIQSALKVSS
ncbi:DinB family protein [Ureibacillus xyleni]|uniref:DinB family protein n=1 Tax=Ureibacillus xyleni TaxID=614648 RepID=A0A285TDM5_9BACL|nr:DinB family protein [Ureibacillus xyleni]SOC18071.1 DinB family protein [Ureibacillus xyleni]